MEIFNIVQNHFGFLFLKQKAEIYHSRVWGAKSGLLLLKLLTLKVKLITDVRDGFYLEVGNIDDNNWVELSVLSVYIHSIEKGKLTANDASKIFQEDFEKIENILCSKSKMKAFIDFKKERATSRFNKG